MAATEPRRSAEHIRRSEGVVQLQRRFITGRGIVTPVQDVSLSLAGQPKPSR
jgi:hypothetical protein